MAEFTLNDDAPDERGPALVVIGSVLEGLKFVGPFVTIDQACTWWSRETLMGQLGVGHVTIALLEPPTRMPRVPGQHDEESE